MCGTIGADRGSCQFSFVVDEKPTFCAGRLGPESGRKACDRFPVAPLARIAERAAAVGLRWQAVLVAQIVWNRSTQIADGRQRMATSGNWMLRLGAGR